VRAGESGERGEIGRGRREREREREEGEIERREDIYNENN
jgi:hypothetical protein